VPNVNSVTCGVPIVTLRVFRRDLDTSTIK